MHILVLGAGGMLGHQLLQRLRGEFDVSGTVRGAAPDPRLRALAPNVRLHAHVRAEDQVSIRRVIEDARPDIVVNCIGVIKQATDVPAETMNHVNAVFPHQLARLTADTDAKLIHFSTDCVFSGKAGPYLEADIPDPIDLYGRSKLLGELNQPGALTLRLSMIGPELQHHRGLLEWALSQRGRQIKGYANALFSGLTTMAIADVVALLSRRRQPLEGLWHVSGDPISKFALLQEINRTYGLGIDIERDEEYLCDRRLDSSRFRAETGWRPQNWEEMVKAMFLASEAADAE